MMKASFQKFLFSLTVAVLVVLAFQVRIQWPQTAETAPNSSAMPLWTEKKLESKGGASFDVAGLNRAFTELASTLSPTVVNIYTKTRVAPRGGRGSGQEEFFRYFFGNPFGGAQGTPPAREAQALGSGFVINEEGVIITNSHVVRMNGRNADSIMVKFLDEGEKNPGHEAKVLGIDESTDVAVLQLKTKRKKPLAVAPLGDSEKLKVGEWVIAIGNPYGHTHSVTKGIVSALSRDLETTSRAEFIQTDASINPGNSGGPLFNLYGEVIGINTAIDARAQGIGFAIPINTAKSVIKQLIEKGEVSLGYAGVNIAEVNPQIAVSLHLPEDAQGALIMDVLPGGPAAKAGLKTYDIVTQVNGRVIQSLNEFVRVIANLNVGAQANLVVLRDGKERKMTLVIGKRPSEKEMANQRRNNRESDNAGPSAPVPTGKTGLLLSDLTPSLRQQLGIDRTLNGVVVHDVVPDSLAAEAGVQPGDVISEINRKPVRNVREADAALRNRGNNFLLKIQRGTASVIILLDMQGLEDE